MNALVRSKSAALIAVAAFAVLLLAHGIGLARILWDLISTVSSDNATHVVVVTEGKVIDGKVTVLDSWKGDLQPGQEITVEELADFSSADSRKTDIPPTPANMPFKTRMDRAWRRSTSWAKGHGPLVYADHVTGSRMILFLIKQEDDGVVNWAPAAFRNEVKTSVAWVEYGYVYGFLQRINPGPLTLSLYRSEEDFKQMVVDTIKRRAYERDSIAAVEKAVKAAAGMASARDRIEALAPFFRWDVYHARKIALNAIHGDGGTALPVLVDIFNDESLNIMIRMDALAAMRSAGRAAGPFLTSVVEREFEFWKMTGPTLQKGWWNSKGLAWNSVQPLRDRYGIMLSALAALAGIDYPESAPVVTEFRDFWRSLPQLEDKSGLDDMSQRADDVLKRQTEAEGTR